MGIRTGINSRLSILVLFSALVITLVMVRYARQILVDDMRDKGESIARLLSVVSMDSMLTRDYGNMERYAYQLVQDRDISLLRVTRADGEVLAAAMNDSRGQETMKIRYPVGIGDAPLGEVEVFFSTERITALSRQIVLFVVWFVLVIHAIGFMLNNVIIERLVVRPVVALIRAASRLRSGDLACRIELSGAREFKELALTFNDMATSLETTIADLRQSQMTIQTEKGKLQTIVESLADGLFVSDSNGTIISFNRAAEEISGFRAEEALGHGCSDLFRTSICADACALSNADKTIRNQPTEIISKDGRCLAVAVSSAILRTSEGQVMGGVQTFRDITEDKARQAMFFQAEKLAAVGRMAAGLAHEINNPLGNIVGYAKLLLRDQALIGASRDKVTIIAEQAKKGSEIVRGLLDFSRQGEGDKGLVSVNEVVAGVVRLFGPQAERRGVELAAAYDDLPPVLADAKQLEQVFCNLVGNALQAVSDSGHIRVTTACSGKERVQVTVADDGPGIPAAQRGRIFDPFFTTKPAGEGTGLGLSICLGIVKDHGGMIEVNNEPAGGTRFVVSLPTVVEEEENV